MKMFNYFVFFTVILGANLYAKEAVTGVELINKDNQPIWVTIRQDGKEIIAQKEFKPASDLLSRSLRWLQLSTEYQAKIDSNEPVELLIWYQKEQNKRQSYKPLTTDLPAKHYFFKGGKTIFVNWNNDVLYPQKGTAEGLRGSTDSGLSLNNNVTQEDIASAESGFFTGGLLSR